MPDFSALEPPTPPGEMFIDKTRLLPDCARRECARCPGADEQRSPVVAIKRSGERRLREDVRVFVCACACHAEEPA